MVAILGTLAAPIMAITKAISVSSSFFSMIDSEKVSYEGLSDADDVSAHEDVEFKDVWFAYPTRSNVQVLKSFDTRFLKGKTTALVGPSGSGKSTIVALLERWYEVGERLEVEPGDDSNVTAGPSDPEKDENLSQEDVQNRGTVSIGGVNINDTNLKWWRSQIGLVQQEPFLFNDTILKNVTFGLLGTKWENDNIEAKRERVERACKEAFADEFIQQLPNVSIYYITASCCANCIPGL